MSTPPTPQPGKYVFAVADDGFYVGFGEDIHFISRDAIIFEHKVGEPHSGHFIWDINLANALCRQFLQPGVVAISPEWDEEFFTKQYPELDKSYAMRRHNPAPTLFVQMQDGLHVCVDGWHRLYRAAMTGVKEIPAYLITWKQAQSFLICKLPPGCPSIDEAMALVFSGHGRELEVS